MPEYRDRSHSPHRSSHGPSSHRRHHHRRSRSPQRSEYRHHDRSSEYTPKPLPLTAVPLHKHDMSTYRPLFALYLDVQKQLDIEELPEDEIKGRWRSFMKKWNAGDLAEGWYDPKTFDKASRGTFGMGDPPNRGDIHKNAAGRPKQDQDPDEDEEEEEEFGPHLPTTIANAGHSSTTTLRAGPVIPTTSDLQARNEEALEDADTSRESYNRHIRTERKADRKSQLERLKDLAPRAEAGTRERQLEKKKDIAASNRTFAAAKEGGGDVELRDADVMGDEDSLGELKRMKEMEQRKKTDREVRREEILRTRTAEREERLKGMREKEAKTMEMLKSIARARFGGGGGGGGEGEGEG